MLGNFRQTAAARTQFNGRKPTRTLRFGMSEAHLKLQRQLPSLVSHENRNIEVHHLKGGPAIYERGVGLKSTDRWSVPLTAREHRDLEALGSRHELAWFMQESMINPYAVAKAEWCATGDRTRMNRVILTHKLIGIPYLHEVRRLGVMQIRLEDILPITRHLSPVELIDVTPEQVLLCLAAERGLVVDLPKDQWRRA